MAASFQFLASQKMLLPTGIGQSVVNDVGALRVVCRPLSQDGTDPVGIAFLGAFYAGNLHVFRVWLKHGSAEVVRIEAHGSLSRMSKVAAHIDKDGKILLRGEEVADLVVSHIDDGLQIEFSFRAYTSSIEWMYLFGRNIRDREGPIFSCGEASIEPMPVTGALPVRHLPLKKLGEAVAICQAFTLINNVFSLTFELSRPGSHLRGLRLSSDLKLAHAGWWTWQLDGLRQEPGELVPQRPVHPIPSPAMMDAFGPGHANVGHSISGVYADWYDPSRMSVTDADRLANLTIHARFDCGTTLDIPVVDILTNPEAVPRSISLVDEHLAACRASAKRQPVLLEVGAKGPASALMRRKVEPAWKYIGLDYLSDANVDVVADAHRLTDYIQPGTVDVVYSSEVMEHLLSPLRFVFEANRVLRRGGIFIARMPTIWPLHAEPWDYWRITQHGWTSLLNVNTGFEILDRCEDGRASVVPHQPELKSGVMLMASAPAPMLTLVVARKVGEVAHDNSGWSPGLSTGTYAHL